MGTYARPVQATRMLIWIRYYLCQQQLIGIVLLFASGLSGKVTSRGACVCISTAFEGNLLDSYFVDLVIQKPLRIHHHSIPVFIPLEKIAAKYLQTDIQHFLFSLCEYLNAYSGRKYQADQLQSDFTALLTGPLQRNSLCNLLSFTYKVNLEDQSFPFCARFLYKDLTRTLPTDVTITYQGVEALPPSWEKQRAPHETLFRVRSPCIECLLHFQEEEKSWIWVWPPKMLFPLGTHLKS